jgi:TolB-like protein
MAKGDVFLSRIAVPEEQVRSALEEILGWDEIARSGQLARFLSYIVDAKLTGRADSIKAYSIAVDVFGRAPSFDPQSDPIVRVQARRLRALLEQFYRETDSTGLVRIRLPVGRYVPEFEFAEPSEPLPEAGVLDATAALPIGVSRSLLSPGLSSQRFGHIHLTRQGWLAAGGLAVAIAAAALLLANWNMLFRDGPDALIARPGINVLEFQNLADSAADKSVVSGLALELVTDLKLFGDMDVSYGQSAVAAGSNPAQSRGGLGSRNFVLSGIARVVEGSVQYGAIIKREGSDAVVWSQAVSRPLNTSIDAEAIREVSRALALVIGSHRGAIDADSRIWLTTQTDTASIASPYICRLLFHIYRDSGLVADAERASACTEALLGSQGESADALAERGSLIVDAVARGETQATDRVTRLADASALFDKAIGLDPTSSFVWEQRARFHEYEGRRVEARSDYASALQLNPSSDDALAASGRMLAMRADWMQGVDAALMAVNGTPEPPAWYYVAPALNALRSSQYAAAIRYAETVSGVDGELGSIIAVVAGNAVGNSDAVNRYLPQVLEQPEFRARGIMTQLGRRISDPILLTLIRTNLITARVPASALDKPF